MRPLSPAQPGESPPAREGEPDAAQRQPGGVRLRGARKAVRARAAKPPAKPLRAKRLVCYRAAGARPAGRARERGFAPGAAG